jgi:molybdopterin converting factor subunit 1
MRVTVKLFAVVRERAGASELSLDVPAGATVASAAAMLGERFPAIGDLIRKTSFAVNCEYAPSDRVLADGDELAFLPAVSGGAP